MIVGISYFIIAVAAGRQIVANFPRGFDDGFARDACVDTRLLIPQSVLDWLSVSIYADFALRLQVKLTLLLLAYLGWSFFASFIVYQIYNGVTSGTPITYWGGVLIYVIIEACIMTLILLTIACKRLYADERLIHEHMAELKQQFADGELDPADALQQAGEKLHADTIEMNSIKSKRDVTEQKNKRIEHINKTKKNQTEQNVLLGILAIERGKLKPPKIEIDHENEEEEQENDNSTEKTVLLIPDEKPRTEAVPRDRPTYSQLTTMFIEAKVRIATLESELRSLKDSEISTEDV